MYILYVRGNLNFSVRMQELGFLTLPRKRENKITIYHPHSNLCKVKKVISSTGLVKISYSFFFIEIYFIMISPSRLYVVLDLLWKWWYFIAMCLVRCVHFRDSAIEIEDRLSLQTATQKLVVGVKRVTMQLIYFANLWTGSASHSA